MRPLNETLNVERLNAEAQRELGLDGEGDGGGDEGAREVVADGGGPGGGATAPLDATLDANTGSPLARDTTVHIMASVPSASTGPVAAEPPAVALENAVGSTGPVAAVPATASVPSASTGPVAAEPAAVALESAGADPQDAALEARLVALRSPAFAQLAAATVVSVGGTAWALASGAWAAMLSDVDDAVERTFVCSVRPAFVRCSAPVPNGLNSRHNAAVTINEVAGDGPRQRCVLVLAVGSVRAPPANPRNPHRATRIHQRYGAHRARHAAGCLNRRRRCRGVLVRTQLRGGRQRRVRWLGLWSACGVVVVGLAQPMAGC